MEPWYCVYVSVCIPIFARTLCQEWSKTDEDNFVRPFLTLNYWSGFRLNGCTYNISGSLSVKWWQGNQHNVKKCKLFCSHLWLHGVWADTDHAPCNSNPLCGSAFVSHAVAPAWFPKVGYYSLELTKSTSDWKRNGYRSSLGVQSCVWLNNELSMCCWRGYRLYVMSAEIQQLPDTSVYNIRWWCFLSIQSDKKQKGSNYPSVNIIDYCIRV